MESPKRVDVVTCKSRSGAKFQAMRWKHSNGTLSDVIYRWTGSDVIARETPATAERLADFVAHYGLTECAP